MRQFARFGKPVAVPSAKNGRYPRIVCWKDLIGESSDIENGSPRMK